MPSRLTSLAGVLALLTLSSAALGDPAARGGIRVRMRWLTVGPYGDVTVFSPGSHFGEGFGLQLGVRLTD
jgi:hypothetical protein